MADSNTPSDGIAEKQQSTPPTQAELESEIGDLVADSLFPEGEEQPKPKATKPAETETAEGEEPPESTDEAETEPEPEEEAPEEEEKPTTVKLKSGEAVTLEELEKGYLRQQDYTRKTQEVAKNNRELEAAAKRFVEQDKQVKETYEFAQRVLEQFQPRPPDVALMDTDPIRYMKEDRAFQQASQAWARLQEAKHQAEQRLGNVEKAYTQEELQQEYESLVGKVPALATDEGYRSFQTEAVDYGSKVYGFDPDEIKGIKDHRYLHALADAIAYRKLQSKKMEAVREARKGPPPLRPPARPAPNRATQQTQKALYDRARQSGSVDDIAALLDIE
jgi:hypothetical protein